MFDVALQTIQLISLVVGITVGLLTISKHFRESGFFRNIMYIVAIVVPVVFLKIIIVVCSTDFYILLICLTVMSLFLSGLPLFAIKENRQNSITELLQSSEITIPIFLSLTPLISLVINLLLGFNNVFNFNLPAGVENYLLCLNSQKIALNSYAYMNKNLLLTGYFIGKCIEIILIIIFIFYGIYSLWKINDKANADFSSYSHVEYYASTSPKQNLYYLAGAIFTLAFFSSNYFVKVLQKVLSWF